MPYKNRKNLYKILFIAILLGFIISLAGCSWLSLGLLNVFDPQAQIKVTAAIDLTEDTIELEIYSINQVEFIGTSFEYEYYVGTTKITSLTKTVGQAFYVEASSGPGIIGEITTVSDLPLYYQEAKDYMTSNPLVTELTCTITLIGTDGAGHSISKEVTVDLPALEPGIDFTPPTAVITVKPGPTGTAPFTVVFDASDSCDKRNADDTCDKEGIASYNWDFGDRTTGTGVMPAAHTYVCGIYIVKLTVTDFWGNKGYATEIINVGETGATEVIIQVTPGTTGNAPFKVFFDASGTDCGCGATYSWNFGDESPAATGVTTSHTYISNGVYIVILTITDSTGISYGSVTITVGVSGAVNAVINTTPDPPTGTASFTVGLDASESTTSASGETIVSYTWNFDTGTPLEEVFTGDPPIPVTTHTYGSAGTYLVKLTVEDSAGNVDYAFKSIIVTAE